jgi:Mg2+-importing ATPase
VVPEALPVVTTIALSKGAARLARNQVVVKRLSAVEDLGSIEVLCTDKTGTLTENKMSVAEIKAGDDKKCLFFAALASSFLGEKKHEPNNSFDVACWDKLPLAARDQLLGYHKITEIPFDPTRRYNSVLVARQTGDATLIVRGAPEVVLDIGNRVHRRSGQSRPANHCAR